MDQDIQIVGKHQEDILLVGSFEVGNLAAEGMLREGMPQEEVGTVPEDIHGHHDGHGVRITLCQIHLAYPLHHPCFAAKVTEDA